MTNDKNYLTIYNLLVWLKEDLAQRIALESNENILVAINIKYKQTDAAIYALDRLQNALDYKIGPR